MQNKKKYIKFFFLKASPPPKIKKSKNKNKKLKVNKNWDFKKSEIFQKITFFFKNLKIQRRKKNFPKNAILLALSFEGIGLWPELSSTPRFRI